MDALIISWTIRLSLLCFFTSLVGWAVTPGLRAGDRDGSGHLCVGKNNLRLVWTIGWLLFLGHVFAAFHLHHHWDHQAAVEETARQTEELLGFRFGLGVYFNYLFLVIWAADVMWLWLAAEVSFKWPRLMWLGYLVFIAFNGTAVFKTGWLRLAGIVAILLLVASLAYHRFRSTAED